MKKIINFLILVSFSQFSLGQEYQAQIKPVLKSGFYKIELTPEIRSATQNKIQYLRILNQKKEEVPYVVFQDDFLETTSKNLPLKSKEAIKNVLTSVVFINENKQNIDGLILEIANTEVSKNYHISGSNDNLQWFGLVNNQRVSNLNDSKKTSVERFFSFPLNNYKYLKFEFIDKKSLPINILNAKINFEIQKNKNQIELTNFEQNISVDKIKKQTKITFSFDAPQVIDGINFEIQSPKFYQRNAQLLVDKTKIKGNKEISYVENLMNFTLNSNHLNGFEFQSLYLKDFFIVIDNLDNPELKFSKIDFFQNKESLIVELNANENYTVSIDDRFKIPNYDLAESGIDLKSNFELASVSELKKITQEKLENKNQHFWQTSLFMWICIGFAVLILAYFSFGMIRDLRNEK